MGRRAQRPTGHTHLRITAVDVSPSRMSASAHPHFCFPSSPTLISIPRLFSFAHKRQRSTYNIVFFLFKKTPARYFNDYQRYVSATTCLGCTRQDATGRLSTGLCSFATRESAASGVNISTSTEKHKKTQTYTRKHPTYATVGVAVFGAMCSGRVSSSEQLTAAMTLIPQPSMCFSTSAEKCWSGRGGKTVLQCRVSGEKLSSSCEERRKKSITCTYSVALFPLRESYRSKVACHPTTRSIQLNANHC